MRNADTVLGIFRERGKQGLPVEDLYRQLYNKDLYLRAYAHLYPNQRPLNNGSQRPCVALGALRPRPGSTSHHRDCRPPRPTSSRDRAALQRCPGRITQRSLSSETTSNRVRTIDSRCSYSNTWSKPPFLSQRFLRV